MYNLDGQLKRTCILTIEVGEREWDPAILLANVLCKRGYRVFICTNRAVKILEKKLSSSIFLHKSTIEKYAVRYQSTLGAVVCFLDTEAGITLPDHRYDKYCSERFKEVSKEKYTTVFTIGEKHRTAMSRMKNFDGINLVASGWPRLELLSLQQRSYYDERVADLKSKYGDFVLAVSSFGFVNLDEYKEWVKADKEYFGKDYESPAWPHLDKFVNLLEECDIKLQSKLILRPHPAEFIPSWQSRIGRLENVKIILDGDIIPWLLAAKFIIQFRSSTALEAAILGKESLALKIDSDVFETNAPVYELNHEFDTNDELIEYINSKIRSYDIGTTSLSNLATHISNLEGSPSNIIADEIDKVDIQEVPMPKISFFRKLRHQVFMWFSDIIEKLFFNTIVSPPTWRYVFTYRYKLNEAITSYNCEKRLRRLADPVQNLNIQQVSRDLVCLEVKNETK